MQSSDVELIRMPLQRLGLEPIYASDEMILCPLFYENGTEVVFAVLLVDEAGWFGRRRKVAVLSLCELGPDGKPKIIHFQKRIPAPNGPHDIPFSMEISAQVRAMAWALAGTTDLGECINLRKPPEFE